jgi:hypothetical protein
MRHCLSLAEQFQLHILPAVQTKRTPAHRHMFPVINDSADEHGAVTLLQQATKPLFSTYSSILFCKCNKLFEFHFNVWFFWYVNGYKNTPVTFWTLCYIKICSFICTAEFH